MTEEAKRERERIMAICEAEGPKLRNLTEQALRRSDSMTDEDFVEFVMTEQNKADAIMTHIAEDFKRGIVPSSMDLTVAERKRLINKGILPC